MTDEAKKPKTAHNIKARDDDQRGAPKGKFGNPPFVPTEEQRQQAKTLSQVFPRHAEHFIAAKMGISRSTLERHFRDDMTLGRAEMLASVGAQLIQLAIRGKDAVNTDGKLLAPGDLDAMKFILARLGGWTTKVEMTGKDGGPIESVDLSRLSKKDLEEYGRLAALAEGLDPEEVVGHTDD